MSRQTVVGLIGLGRMGQPMAARLAGAGFALVLNDQDQARAAGLAAALGGQVAETPRALAAQADIIITMLPTSAEVAAVVQGADGVLAALRPGTLLIEMSSGQPARSRALAAEVVAAGGRFIDAPVSGGVARAETGQLAIMAGGDPADIATARPVLDCLGSSILATGPVGTAHAMKALNNLCSAAGLLIASEALAIGRQAGLDPAVMVDILNVSTGMNNATRTKLAPFVLSGQFNSGFGMDLMVKDLGIALDVAEGGGVEAPFAALCRQIWAEGASRLGRGRDHTEIARLCGLPDGTGGAA